MLFQGEINMKLIASAFQSASEDMYKDFETGSFKNICEWRNNQNMTKFTDSKMLEFHDFKRILVEPENSEMNLFMSNEENSKILSNMIRRRQRIDPVRNKTLEWIHSEFNEGINTDKDAISDGEII